MPGEQTLALPDELSEWLDDRAAETGRSRETLLARALMAYRLVEEGDYEAPDPESVHALENRIDTVDELEDLAGDVDDRVDDIESEIVDVGEDIKHLEGEVDEHVADLRDRVVQVLQEVDSKAAADHSHSEVTDSVADHEETLADHDEWLDALDGRLVDLEDEASSVEKGFEEFSDRADDVEEKLSKLASATVLLQRRVAELEGTAAKRDAVADLQAVATRHDIAEADCGHCGRTVHLGLLAEPRCPHCERQFDTVESAASFFGSARLTTSDPPALNGETGAAAEDPMDLFHDE